MRQTWTIFRKDLRHLWPWTAVLAALFLFHGWIDLRLEHEFLKVLNSRGYRLEPIGLFLCCWVLVAVLVQQERLPGNRQYWLTRPISRWSVVLAKALFLATFVCLPNFLVQAAVLAWTGFSPFHYAGALVWNQALVAMSFTSAAALAAVTRNLRQYVALSLASFGLTIFLEDRLLATGGGQWMGVAWAQEAAVLLAGVVAGGVVLALQYRWRSTAKAFAVLGVSFAGELLVLNLPWWHTAFAITEVVRHRSSLGSQIRVTMNPSALPTVHADLGHPIRVAFPVRIAGIPHGQELASERVAVELETAGVHWTSGWLTDNEIAKRTVWHNEDEWLTEDGAYWLAFNLPGDLYWRLKGRSIRLHVSLALSLYSAPVVTKLPPHPRAYPVEDGGHCTLETIHKMSMLHCMRPFTVPVAFDFQIDPHGGGKSREVPGCCLISYGPIPAEGRFSVWADVGAMPEELEPGPDDTISVEVRRPLSFLERQLNIDTTLAEQ